MAEFTWIPDRAAALEAKATVNKAKFGDGYEQRTPEGLNNVGDDWSLSFTVRTKAEILAIRAFLKARKGSEAFDWTNPFGEAGKYTCEQWSASVEHDTDCSLQATFHQVFE